MLDRLPKLIVVVMVGTILTLALALGASTVWLTRALDLQARVTTERQVGRALEALLEGTELLTYDYAKWTEAVNKAAAADLGWFDENMGLATVVGEACQLSALWGGRFQDPYSWAAGGPEQGRTGLIDPQILGWAEARLAGVPLALFDGTSFFGWHEGGLYAIAASRIELPADFLDGPPPPDEEMARIFMARKVDEAVIRDMAEDYDLVDLRIVPEPVAGLPSIPLLDGVDRPLAQLVWDPPRPGSRMLRRMALPILGVVLLTMAAASVGIALVRRHADALVRAERQASTAARTDPLTGLPNRAAFNDALAARAPAGERAVLFLDVNDFKRINDDMGHDAGDQVIVGVARRLAGFAEPGCFLARIAGDEFVFLVGGPDVERRARWLADAVATSLASPLHVDGHALQVSMAIGCAVQAADDVAPELLRRADLAMYAAKQAWRRNGGQGSPLPTAAA